MNIREASCDTIFGCTYSITIQTQMGDCSCEWIAFLAVLVVIFAAMNLMQFGFYLYNKKFKKISIISTRDNAGSDKIKLEIRKKERPLDIAFKQSEISHSNVNIEKELGRGEFGVVYKGAIYGLFGDDYKTVAIKTTKTGSSEEIKNDLVNEMRLILDIGFHPNIMPLLASCTMQEPFLLITEYMEYGDLLRFLRKCREESSSEEESIYSLTEVNQLHIAKQIAQGMDYVASKRYYHGDLAARNVLIGEGLLVKISDFGLADDLYLRSYKKKSVKQKIPLKWVSLETIQRGILSSEGDVWAFGILMYEIFTLGGTPYPDIPTRLLTKRLDEGYRMEQPEWCPDDVYQLMFKCWSREPMQRPKFSMLSLELKDMLVERSEYFTFSVEDNPDTLQIDGENELSLAQSPVDNAETPKSNGILSLNVPEFRACKRTASKVKSMAPIVEENENDTALLSQLELEAKENGDTLEEVKTE